MISATATDEDGNTVSCTFNATRNALKFYGFASPIGCTGGSCSYPKRSFNVGSDIPIKFELKCGYDIFRSGTPTLKIKKCGSTTPAVTGNFTMVSDVWHFNWKTTGLAKGVYEVIATLQDGTTRNVFIKLK